MAQPDAQAYDALLLAVAHDELRTLDEAQLNQWMRPDRVIYDLKYVLPRTLVDVRL